MLLSAVSVLVVAQSSSEIPEGLMNNPVYRLLAVLRTNLRRFEQNSQNILLHCINFYFYKPASVVFVVLFYCCKEVTTNLRILHTFLSSDITCTLLYATVTVTVALQTVS